MTDNELLCFFAYFLFEVLTPLAVKAFFVV